jgi:hypothetical protein
MYRTGKKKWSYHVLALVVFIQLCFIMSGISEDNVFADKSVKNKLDTPDNIQTSATVDTISVEWEPVKKAVSYEIEINGNVTQDIIANEYTFTGLESDTEYALQIRAIGKKSASEWSTAVIQKTAEAEPVQDEENNQGELGIPENISYEIELDEILFYWDEVSGAESYDTELNSSITDNVTVTEYIYGGIDPEAEYIFRVRSVNDTAKSGWSEEVRVQASDSLPIEEEEPLVEQEVYIGNGNGLEGEYYDNRNLKDLAFIRKDREINFDWGDGSPDPSIKKSTYSVRWTGKLLAEYTAPYAIYTYTGDGIRLWLDDELIINDWKGNSTRENIARVDLEAGEKYDITLEYYSNNKDSKAILSWSCAYKDKEVIPMQQLFCKPDTPANINTLAEGSRIIVTWDNTLGAEGYEIEVDGEVIDNDMETEYVHSGLEADTEHTYRIRAVNDVSIGNWTELITKISAPPTPNYLSAVVDTTNILVSWDSVDTATGYDIEVNSNIIDNGDSISYLHEGLNPNTKCTYRVRAKNENGISDWSELLTKTTLPATPENVSAEPSSKSMDISWDAVDGAITYEIEADGQVVPDIMETSYVFEGLDPDTAYTYRVRARNIEGAGYWSDPITKKTLLETPSGITSEITDISVSLSWLPVNRATGYEIEIDGGDIVYTTEVTFVNEGLLPNSEHSYRVKAKNDDNISEWSEKVTRLTLPDTPRNLVSSSTSYRIALNWEDIPGAKSYDIEANGRIIDSTPDAAYMHEGLQPMTEYNYRVRAVSIAGAGYWSEPISEITKVGVPANINAVSTSTTITFTWDEASEADRYEIELDGLILDNGSDTAYEYTDLMANSAHTYRVRAVNEIGNGDWSQLKTKYTAPDVPGNINAASTSKTITLTWAEVEAATGYDVEVLGSPEDNGNSTTYTHMDLNPNTQRIYRVRAKNENGIGDWSEIIVKSTLPGAPSNLRISSTETAIKFTWDAIAGATAYDVEVDDTMLEDILNNEYTLSGLEPNSRYDFRVRAKNDDGNGDWSEVVTGSTLPAAPTIISVESSDNSVRTVWESVYGAAEYDIEADGLVIDCGISSEYTHHNLLPNTKHTYRVRSKSEYGIGNWTNLIEKLTLPDIPRNLAAETTSSSVKLTWDKVDGAIEYEIEADGVVWSVGIDTSYLNENLTPNTGHIYRVRAKSEAGAGNWSVEVKAFTLFGMPQNIKTFSSGNSIKTVWDEVYGVTGYEIEADGNLIDIGPDTKYIHSNLMSNTTHIYRIRAIKDTSAGDWSERTFATTLLASITDIKAVSTSTAITFSWTPIGDAESYDVEADGNIATGILEPEYKAEGLIPNTPHTFRVMAKSESNTSDWSELLTKYTTPDIPGNIILLSTTSSITSTWEAVYGAVGYDIEVDGVIIDNGIEMSYVHEGLSPNTQHVYRLRARNEHEVSEWSVEAIGTTEPELVFNIAEDNLFNFVIAAPRVEEVTERTITVTYNPEELEAVDLCAATSNKDIEVGEIPGSNLEVREYTPGIIAFSLKDPSKAIMNAIKFKAKINGQSKILYVIE